MASRTETSLILAVADMFTSGESGQGSLRVEKRQSRVCSAQRVQVRPSPSTSSSYVIFVLS